MAYNPRSVLVVMPVFSVGIAYFWSCEVDANARAARWLVDGFSACCAGLFPPELRPGRAYPAALECNLLLSRFLFVANLAIGALYVLSTAGSALLSPREYAPATRRRWLRVSWSALWALLCVAGSILFFRLYFQQRFIADTDITLFVARVGANRWTALIELAYAAGFFLSALGAVLWLRRAFAKPGPAT